MTNSSSLAALVRRPPWQMSDGLVTFMERTVVDMNRAQRQHEEYEAALQELGVEITALSREDEMSDSTFVEDIAVILDELAIVTRPATERRRAETASVVPVLARHRSTICHIAAPATLEGGDVLLIGRTLYVGVSSRTNEGGIAQLARLLAPYDYNVVPVAVTGCLHLKTGCGYVGDGALLVNSGWLDRSPLQGFELIEVPVDEPFGANVIRIGDTVLAAASAPKTAAELEARGFHTRSVDISEFEKVEAGLSCCSIIFSTLQPGQDS